MPQMMPMNWLILFSMFTLMTLLIILMNYYFSLFNKTTLNNYNYNIKPNYWKW